MERENFIQFGVHPSASVLSRLQGKFCRAGYALRIRAIVSPLQAPDTDCRIAPAVSVLQQDHAAPTANRRELRLQMSLPGTIAQAETSNGKIGKLSIGQGIVGMGCLGSMMRAVIAPAVCPSRLAISGSLGTLASACSCCTAPPTR